MRSTSIRRIALGSLLAVSMLFGTQAGAATVADKVEQLGQMSYLKVDTIRVVRRNDLLNVQAELINTSNSNQQLYYRFKWLDDAGFTVGSEEAWKPVLIYGNQKKLIESVAPTSTATDFRIEMNSPDNTGSPR